MKPKHIDHKQILLKNTRFFSKVKFLMLIYLVERKVTKIVQASSDAVFEEYEVLYQINAINLSKKDEPPLIWEVTPEEVRDIAEGITSNVERAKYLMRRIQIFNTGRARKNKYPPDL